MRSSTSRNSFSIDLLTKAAILAGDSLSSSLMSVDCGGRVPAGINDGKVSADDY